MCDVTKIFVNKLKYLNNETSEQKTVTLLTLDNNNFRVIGTLTIDIHVSFSIMIVP